ncbi:MAG TPA: efflux transporter outer membrane subunit [Burkholderiaceae bacterium]|nr:efflux transporter outer membrane subunit [Burkholderiaceae bacterium]
MPMRLRRALAPLCAATLLAACSMVPPYERPPLAVAERFPTTTPDTAAGPAAADLEWRQVFTDPRQQRLIELALQNNRDLRLAALNVEQAQARWQIQHASLWPTVSAGIGGNRQALPNGNSVTTYSAGLLVTAFELDFFGRLRSLSDAAQAQAVSAEDGRRATQIALIASVAAVHLSLLADDELLKLTQETLDSRVESLRLTQLRFDNGAASELDLRLAQSVVSSARAALSQVQRARALDQNLLVLLVGAPLPADLPEGAPSLAEMPAFPALPVGMPASVLQRRPDILAAEQQLVAANFNIGAARAAYFPQVTITASAGSVASEFSGLFKGGSWGWSVAPQALLTLFDSGRNRAINRLADASRDAALAQYDKTVQTAFREVSDALAGRDTLSEEARQLDLTVQAESARNRLVDLRFRNGVASSLDLLDSQRSLFATQTLALQSRLAQAQNQVVLYKVLGGGWTETTTTSKAP